MAKLPPYTLNKTEIEIVKLSQLYTDVRKMFGMANAHNRVLPVKKDPRMGLNWKHFKKLHAVMKEFDLIDPFQYITAQLLYARHLGNQCPCSWLASEKSMERYAWYLDNRDTIETKFKKDNVDYITLQYESLKTTILFMYRMKKKHGYKDWYEFYTAKHGILPRWIRWYVTGNITKIILSVSKSYKRAHGQFDMDVRDVVPNPNHLGGLRLKILMVPKIKQLILKCFPGELDI